MTVFAARLSPDALRGFTIALISFLTLVDLFAAQAILPALVARFEVTPAAMGFAVNASTIGMAAAGLVVALASAKIDRPKGVWLSLTLLAAPTAALAFAQDLTTFTALRVAQGVFMSTAFTLTMTYLAEECGPEDAAGAMAAYITGNVLSNLLGRLLAAGFVDALGISQSFLIFAGLNLAGAVAAYLYMREAEPHARDRGPRTAEETRASWRAHLANPRLLVSFAIGFSILFVFIGAFTYVNFVLAAAPFALAGTALGLVYFVFVPSLLTTPAAGAAANRFGTRPTFWVSAAISLAALGLLLASSLVVILAGLAILGAALFFAQASVTGFVGRAADGDRAAASGLYLTSYYLGGLAGGATMGAVFESFGWTATVMILAGVTFAALLLGSWLKEAPAPVPMEARP